jgi:ABC-2 type transport system ATP-binding protein
LTTHYIEEAERLCDRVAFIVSGRLVRTGAVDHLRRSAQEGDVVQIACANAIDMERVLSGSFPEMRCRAVGQGLIRVEADEPVRVGPLVRFLEDHGAEVSEARRARPSLEDVFVRVTGIEADTMRREKEKAGGGE